MHQTIFDPTLEAGELGTLSAGALIDDAAQRWPNSIAVIEPETGESLTYLQLVRRTSAVSGWLHKLGLRRGSKVVVAAGNTVAALEILCGAIYGRFVPVPCNPGLGPGQLAFVLDHCDGEIVLTCRANLPILDGVLHQCRRHTRLIEVGQRMQLPESNVRPVAGPAEDDALLIYTSGTTRDPKGALHSIGGTVAAIGNTAKAYGLSPRDRFLCVLPLHHANSIHKIFATWSTGGAVVLPPRFEVRRFWRWVDDHHCSWLALVPSIIAQLLQFSDGADHPSVRFARSSSAPLPADWHHEFEQKFNIPLLQGMGATEAGPIFSNPLPPADRKIGSVGKDMVGQEVIIVDKDGNALRDNQVGHIIVRGPSRMKGYYKDAEGTAATLTSDGWFRTGDLGYRDEGGFFFVTGRAKEIVIKAGVNIALREIDEALLCHPSIADAASTGIGDSTLGEDVVAYAVLKPGSTVSESSLLDFCAGKLGAFKTPAAILQISEIPRSPNGKVQRYRLRQRFGPHTVTRVERRRPNSDHEHFVAPRTPMEKLITAVWTDHLDQSPIGIHDDFFALGGYSLLAISMLIPLRRQLGTALSLTVFFEHPNISEQALMATTQRLQGLGAAERRSLLRQVAEHARAWRAEGLQAKCDYESVKALALETRAALEAALLALPASCPAEDRIPQRPAGEFCALSFAQERIWFMGQISSEAPLYNTGDAVRLRGRLDMEALERAINTLVERHEVLRCAIHVIDGRPRQKFRQQLRIIVAMRRLEISHEAELEQAVQSAVRFEFRRPYSLDNDPLIRATILELGSDDHVLILCMHHIVCDGLSIPILLHELGIIYRDQIHGTKSELPKLPIQYGDFATWQRHRLLGEKRRREAKYWSCRLKGVPTVLDLPTDRPRPTALSYRGNRLDFQLRDGVTDRLQTTCRDEQVSPFTILSAAFAALLFRYTAQPSFVVGLHFADRDRPELQSLVGLLLDTHVIHFALSGETPFREVIGQSRSEVAESYAHRHLPFEQIVDAVQPQRDLGRTPLCQVALNWREPGTRLSTLSLEGTSTQPVRSHDGTSKFDLTMTFTSTENQIGFDIEYSTDLFDDTTIERMAGHYQCLLEAAIVNPACPVGELPLLTDCEYRQTLLEWNNTSATFPGAETLHELFEEQVRRSPDATAVVSGGIRITYRELNERANRLAWLLNSRGVGPEVLVGIFMDRSPEMVIGLYAVLKAGGAYLPLDPDYPAERLELMVAETRTALILTQHHLRDHLPAQAQYVLVVDEVLSELARFHASNPVSGVSPANAAYVIYTSGSSGRPKGVINTHTGIVNQVQWMQKHFRLDASDRVLQKTSHSFDVSAWELFWPLLSGAQLVIAEPGGHRDAGYLVREIIRRGITTAHFVPTMLRLFLEHPEVRSCVGLKRVLCAGEVLSHDLQLRFFSLLDAELYNLYGPTEAAVSVTAWRCRRHGPSKIVPIGRPIANTRIYIVDAGLQPVPVGVAGELLIGGVQVARGYLSRPELTSERFVEDPFTGSGRLYRTGDLARWIQDGNVEYLGRLDQQVKLRGLRIELGEIEAVLSGHDQVQTCAASLREDTPGQPYIVAYVVASAGRNVADSTALRAHLNTKLPDYMIPDYYVPLAALPLSANGKLDRSKLPIPGRHTRALNNPPAPPCTPIERCLAEIWADFLGLEQVGIHDDFFEHGGHSLLAMQIMMRANEALGLEMPWVQLFETPTVAGLAKAAEAAKCP